MKSKRTSGKGAVPLRFYAFCLCGAGLMALVVSLLLMFGWLFSEGPQPSTADTAVTGALGLLVLAASISCFIIARRLTKDVC